MHPALQFTLEAHTAAATLYLHGTLQPQSAVGAFRSCYTLPPAVRRLVVDLRGVSDLVPGTGDTVEILLDEWRRARGGEASVARPPAPGAPRLLGPIVELDGGLELAEHGNDL